MVKIIGYLLFHFEKVLDKIGAFELFESRLIIEDGKIVEFFGKSAKISIILGFVAEFLFNEEKNSKLGKFKLI